MPQLGSQIYTMAGMTTQLNLLADRPGQYPGLSSQFSGDGFSGMRFVLEAVPPDQFAAWTASVRGKGGALDARSYAALAKPSQYVAPTTYGTVEPGLFMRIVDMTPAGAAPQPAHHDSAMHGAQQQGSLTNVRQAHLGRHPLAETAADHQLAGRADGDRGRAGRGRP